MYCHICGTLIKGETQKCPTCGAKVLKKGNSRRTVNRAELLQLVLQRRLLRGNSAAPMGATSSSALYSDFGWENLQILNSINAGSHTTYSVTEELCRYMLLGIAEE